MTGKLIFAASASDSVLFPPASPGHDDAAP
jgi:hypothetical protein